MVISFTLKTGKIWQRRGSKIAPIAPGSMRPETLKPYDKRAPSKLEMVFSYLVVSIVTLLGLLILFGAFGIDQRFKLPLGVILVGYGLIRFWMLKSRFGHTGDKEESLEKPDKEEEKNLRNQ